ncbi:MAG: HepT-like ribonuclease domain-containing protein [Chloroflexota bacterium]
MKRGDRERLDDIAEAIATIRAQAADNTSDERLKRDAILYNLLILGEAVKNLDEGTTAQRPEIPWKQIAGLRDLLAHEYYRIDIGMIEDIIERDLTALDAAVAVLRNRRARGGKRSSARIKRRQRDA